jgi:integrase
MGRDGSGVRAASGESIEITFSYRGVRCRERLPLEPTAPNLKRAARHRAAIQVAIENGTFDYAKTFPRSPRRLQFLAHPTQGQTVEKYLGEFLAGQKGIVKASTLHDYRKIIDNQIAPSVLGPIALADLDRAAIRKFCTGLTAGNKRIANILSVLRLALAQAVQDNVLQVNVLDGWSYTKAEPIRETDDVDVFTAEEQSKVLVQLAPRNRNWFQFAFWTGLRTSEMIALEWRDIDFAVGTIRVVRAETHAASEPEAPKTKSSRRGVKMLAPAREALLAQKEHTLLAGARVWHINNDQAAREIWKLACHKAGVRYRKPYQTRHTYASMMLTAGESPMWVAQQMGHSDWGMIRTVYGHFIPDSHPYAGRAAETMFGATAKLNTAMQPPAGHSAG